MPANKRPRKLNYWVHKKWPKSWSKVAKAVNHYKKLKTIRKIYSGEELTLKYSLYDICDYL